MNHDQSHAKVYVRSYEWRLLRGLVASDHGVMLQLILRMQTEGYVYTYESARKQIGEQLGLSERSVYRSIRNLDKAGAVVKVKTNVYQINTHLAWIGSESKRMRLNAEHDTTNNES
jgi:biotin operon repressor